MIYRANHENEYLCVLNSAVRDNAISCEACGLLVRMLSMNDDWSFSADGLASMFGISVLRIRRLVGELRAAGYVQVRQSKNARGRFGSSVWDVYEVPHRVIENREADNRVTENRETVNRVTVDRETDDRIAADRVAENDQHKKYQLEEIPNIRSTNGKKYIPGRGEFLNVFISDSEFEKLTDRFGDVRRDSLIEDLSRYLAAHPKKKYASHYATMLAWARKDEKDTTATPAPIPTNRDGGIDWDRVAQLAEKGGSA